MSEPAPTDAVSAPTSPKWKWGFGRKQQPPEPDAEDLGLYRVLGLTPDASDAEIQVAYRRQAAKLATSELASPRRLRELNVAYETLGNPARRTEYDRLRLQPPSVGTLPPPSPVLRSREARPRHRRSNRRRGGSRTTSSGDLLALLAVVVLAVVAAFIIVPRISFNLPSLGVAGGLGGISSLARPGTPGPTADEPVAIAGIPVGPSPVPSGSVPLTDQFRGSSVSMSASTPARYTPVSVVVRLRRNNQPAADVDVFATIQYRTTRERWPQSGATKTDQTGTTAITFDVGDATPGFEAKVTVTALVEGQELTWATSFTPR